MLKKLLEMRSRLISIPLIFLLAASMASGAPENRFANEPIQNLIQNALSANPKIFAKNKTEAAYINAFLPLWTQLLNQLFSQDATEARLEPFFAQNYEAISKTSLAFQKLKPPSDFKNFQDVLTKGLEELSDWCLDMRDRIHYAKTPYQKQAYMKRIEGFRTEWYDTFFGDALDEITNRMSIFLATHWVDELDAPRLKALNPALKQYLTNYHKISLGHLKSTEDITQKVRESREKNKGEDDPRDYAENLTKELDSLKKTVASLKKINPPEPFKEFHALELSWLDTRIRGTQIILNIRDANVKHSPDEQVQALISQKNEIEQEAQTAKAGADKAYLEALKKI